MIAPALPRVSRKIPAWLLSVAVALPISAGTGRAAPPVAPSEATTAKDVPGPLFWDPRDRPQKPEAEVSAIRFLTAGDFPPFDFLDSEGHLAGYHVDLARMICRELAVACTIQMRPFGDLVTALGDRRGDAILAGLRVTAEMRESLDTSDAYLTTPARFVTRTTTELEPTPESLAGRWVSVVSGSAHEAYLLAAFPNTRLAAYPDETSARDALRDGKVEAHFGDAIALSFWLSAPAAQGCCDFRGGPWLDGARFGEGLRVVFPRGNLRLRANIDYALRKLAIDGRLAELYLRWFPRGFY